MTTWSHFPCTPGKYFQCPPAPLKHGLKGVHSSFIQTEVGNNGARAFGLEKAHITVEESISGLVRVVSFSRPKEYKISSLGRKGASWAYFS